MTSMSTEEAAGRFSDIVRRAAVSKERVVLTQQDEDLVAVVPIEDLQRLQALEDLTDTQAAHAALAEEGSIPLKDLKAELGL